MGDAAPTLKIPPRRKPTPEFTVEDLATALLPVLACLLGGATAKWAEGLVVAFLGVLLMLNPPRFSLGPAMHVVLLALVACAATAFLPAGWFPQPAWRAALINDLGITLPTTLSPQPWISFGCLLSFLAGLSWFYYACGHEAEMRAGRRELRIFAGGVVFVAGVAVLLYLAHRALPFWHNPRGFGPFPNRNQTANLFGLTSVVVLVCGYESIRRRKWSWIFWGIALAVLVTAIILNLSRAGIALLLLGNALWLAVLVIRGGVKGGIAIGVSALLLLLTALLIFGGQTLERFGLREDSAARLIGDFRWLVFRDAWQLIQSSPWFGIGLGNFESVFAIFRNASLDQHRALHPESDWLWLCAEMGWPAVLLVIVGLVLILPRAFPFVEGTNQWFRIAAVIAALLFALHGLFDVSGHRVGTAYAGLFFLGLALRRPLQRPASYALMYFFRGAGLLLFCLGMAWLVAGYRMMPLPGSMGADIERERAAAANVSRDYAETMMSANRGLAWAPLDWRLYFLRAVGKVGTNKPAEALEDFRRARFLEPGSFEVPYQEGLAWIQQRPTLAIAAWREALRRAGDQRPELYSRMLSAAPQLNPAVTRMLEELADTQPDLALSLLERAKGEDFDRAAARLLAHDSSLARLTAEQKRKLFALWSERGDRAQIVQLTEQRPELLEFAWRGVAMRLAEGGEFERAISLTKRFGEKPVLPSPSTGRSREQLEQDAIVRPNDYETGFTLFQQQMEQNRIDDALVTVRRYAERADAPRYFHYLEAEAWAAKGNWERAWNARRNFDHDAAAK